MMRLSSFNVFALGAKTAEKYKNASERINKKISGTFIEKAAIYMKTIWNDYKEVAVSVRSDIKEKPLKAAGFFTGMGFTMYCLTHNPNEQSFRAKFIQCSNDVSLVSSNLVNGAAVEHMKMIQTCYNRDLIRYTNLGLFSIIWVDKYSDQCNMYETNCSYLKLPYRKFASQVIDVGFLNIWWVISRKMLDYDINY
ncbi:mitochondrial import inner membrane translocase subunit Tim29 [Tribolium madens]|uniref:mitochondrial import inner membrane translocase subunit Tim29 n=1 Tax=Tribolium madens TaxID=41895 RepID=UPI001CF73010|nr:mitochondrial import inner membrane translocase subunit Tim29 [Tribolium madens]